MLMPGGIVHPQYALPKLSLGRMTGKHGTMSDFMECYPDNSGVPAALFVHEAAQSASVAASPFQWGHQIAWLISLLALPVLVGATVLLLVVLPALDTLSAGQVQTLPQYQRPHPLFCLLLVSLYSQACHVKPACALLL